MAESPIQRATREARRREKFAEAERPTGRAFRTRGGEFVEVEDVNALEAFVGGIIDRGADAGISIEQLFATEAERDVLQQKADARFFAGSERRIQQPFATQAGAAAPLIAGELLAGPSLAAQVAVGFTEGFFRSGTDIPERLKTGAQIGGLAAAGNRAATAFSTRTAGPQAVTGGTSRSQALRQNLLDEGITLSPAELADSALMGRFEIALETFPFGAAPVQARRQLNQLRVNQSARKALGLEDIESDVLTVDDLVIAEELAIDGLELAGQRVDDAAQGPLTATTAEISRIKNIISANKRNLATGETSVDEAQSVLNLFEGEGRFIGADLVEQRRNVIKAAGEASATKAEGLAQIGGVLDDMIESRLGREAAAEFKGSRERFRLAQTLKKPGSLSPEGNVNVGKGAVNRLNAEFRQIPRREAAISDPDIAAFKRIQEGMALDRVLPFKSSGTAERLIAAGTFGGGNLAFGPEDADPLLRFLTGAALPAVAGRALTTRTGRALLSPSTPAARGGAAIATGAGPNQQEPTFQELEENVARVRAARAELLRQQNE